MNFNQKRRPMKRLLLGNIVALCPFFLIADGNCQPPIMPDGKVAYESSYHKINCKAKVYEHRFNFGLLNIGYERISPNSVYTGFDARMASIINTDVNKVKSIDHYANGELRLGYNHQIGDVDRVTGYGGIGFSVFSVEKEAGKLKNWNYGMVGAKYLHQFGPIFEMGLHLKGYMSISAKRYEADKPKKIKSLVIPKVVKANEALPQISTIEFVNQNGNESHLTAVKVNDSRWLTELGVPLIWHVGEKKNWEIMIEPYYMQIPNEKLTHIIGSRAAMGYYF